MLLIRKKFVPRNVSPKTTSPLIIELGGEVIEVYVMKSSGGGVVLGFDYAKSISIRPCRDKHLEKLKELENDA